MNLFYLFILWSTLFQVADGEIAVTLVNENQSPIGQEGIEFVTEQQQVLGSCVTNSGGRCTITIQNAPTDASGFIRGSLLLGDRGRRPVLWPGGQIEIQIMLKDGKVDVPSDAYVTRTPKPEATPTAQDGLQATPTVQQAIDATPTVQQAIDATPTVQQAIDATPTVQQQLDATPTVQEQLEATETTQEQNEGPLTQPEQQINIFDSLLQLLLILIMVIALAFYIFSSNKNS